MRHLLCAHLLLLPFGAQSITITKLASLGGGTCLLNMIWVNEVETFDTLFALESVGFSKRDQVVERMR